MSIATPTPQEATDCVAIYYLAGGFSDAINLRDVERWVSLWAPNGVQEIPGMGVYSAGTEELEAGCRRLLGRFETLVQTSHPAALEVSGDEATGRVYVEACGRLAEDGAPFRSSGVYDDLYRRVNGEWRFARRTFHFLFRDEETPVADAGLPVPRLTTATNA